MEARARFVKGLWYIWVVVKAAHFYEGKEREDDGDQEPERMPEEPRKHTRPPVKDIKSKGSPHLVFIQEGQLPLLHLPNRRLLRKAISRPL